MLRIQPVQALKALFGYGAKGPPAIKGLTKSRTGSPFDMGLPSTSSFGYYQKEMQIASERLSVYKELEQMDDDDIIAAALDLYAEDATQLDIHAGRTLWVEAKNEEIAKLGNDLFDRLDVEEDVFAVARELAKYGDSFSAILFEKLKDGTTGPIVGLIPVDPKTVHRQQDVLGRLEGFTRGVQAQTASDKAKLSSPWDYMHLRILGRNRSKKYGTALTFAARRIFRRLRMMEDALVVYRMRRTPDRLVYYLEGLMDLTPEERRQYMDTIRQELRKRQLMDPNTGEIRSELNPLTIDEDLFVDAQAVRVDRLTGTAQVGNVMDIDYMRKRLFGCLKIPPDYLGFSDSRGGFLSQSPLSDQDVQFARTVKRLQNGVIVGYVRLVQIDMAFRGIDPTLEENDFTVKMLSVSYLDELQRAQVAKIRSETIDILQSIGAALKVDEEQWIAYVLKYSGFPESLVQSEPEKIEAPMAGQVPVAASLDGNGEQVLAEIQKNPRLLQLIEESRQVSNTGVKSSQVHVRQQELPAVVLKEK